MDRLKNTYRLYSNPFRITPSNPKEIVWAGFHELYEKIKKRIAYSIRISNSSLVLNWGEYGCGKTHAAKYFCKNDVLSNIAGNNSIPFPLLINFPRSKEPIKDIFTTIIDKLDIFKLRQQITLTDAEFSEALNQSTDNIFIKNIIKLMFNKDKGNDELFSMDINQSLFKGYLYGTADLKKFIDRGIQRRLATENDFAEFLAALFSFMTYNKKYYSCVILWCDEFEGINTLSHSGISSVNNFFRTIIDKSPDNLLIFLNLTQSPSMRMEDLALYLDKPVRTRIKENIPLTIPSFDAIKEYIKELINNDIFRTEETDNLYHPFEEIVIDNVIKDLGEKESIRDYNDAFSLLLEHAEFDEQDIITNTYYQNIKAEIIGWKK